MASGSSEATIPAGVTVAGLDVGGMTPAEARAVLAEQLPAQPITARDGDRTWSVPAADLGIGVDVAATLAQVESAAPNEAITPAYTVDLIQAQAGLVQLSERTNIAAVPGDPPQMGRALEIPVMLDRMRVDLRGELADGTLDLAMIEVAPPEPEPEARRPTPARQRRTSSSWQELALIALAYGVSMDDIVSLNESQPGPALRRRELVIPAAGVYQPSAAEAPPREQRQGDRRFGGRAYLRLRERAVGALLTSTGLPDTPTVFGDYKIYAKYADDMSGPDYFLPQVPGRCASGATPCGTYWHNSFAR